MKCRGLDVVNTTKNESGEHVEFINVAYMYTRTDRSGRGNTVKSLVEPRDICI